ncbi:MAG: hypothetical protein R3F60_12605 [bacterium]
MSAPKTVLLTGGRAAATLELARMLKGRGVRVIMAEHIGWHLSRFSRAIHRHYRVPWPTRDLEGFISALEAIIQAEAVDLVIPTCEEIFHIARRRARLAARCAVYAADLDALVRLHHKGRFIDAARRAGLAVPATTVCTDADSLRAALRGPVVLKPAWSRFAARTILLPEGHRGEPLPTPSPADPWLVQQLIPGRVLCTWGLCHAGRLVAYAAYETRFTLGLGASASVEMLDHPALEAWMARLVEEEGFTGQLGLDLIEAADGTLYGIEANPRITSGLHLFAHDPRLVDRFWTADAPPQARRRPARDARHLHAPRAAPPAHPARPRRLVGRLPAISGGRGASAIPSRALAVRLAGRRGPPRPARRPPPPTPSPSTWSTTANLTLQLGVVLPGASMKGCSWAGSLEWGRPGSSMGGAAVQAGCSVDGSGRRLGGARPSEWVSRGAPVRASGVPGVVGGGRTSPVAGAWAADVAGLMEGGRSAALGPLPGASSSRATAGWCRRGTG